MGDLGPRSAGAALIGVRGIEDSDFERVRGNGEGGAIEIGLAGGVFPRERDL